MIFAHAREVIHKHFKNGTRKMEESIGETDAFYVRSKKPRE